MLDIHQAAPEDLGAIRNLLALCLLPNQDIGEGKADFFVAESERGIIGVAGIEDCGDGLGLFRSLAVMPGYRKQQIARRLLQVVLSHAEALGIHRVYLLTELASDYFAQLGFVGVEARKAPRAIAATRQFAELCPRSAMLMTRLVRVDVMSAPHPVGAALAVSQAAQRHFDAGYHCAESVLLAVADRLGIASPLLPAIASGFCEGVARTSGTCGALSGAIMGVNLVYGRRSPDQAITENYRAVSALIGGFSATCGSSLCGALIACDLDSRDGAAVYRDNRLRAQCREYVGVAARLAAIQIGEKLDRSAGTINRAA